MRCAAFVNRWRYSAFLEPIRDDVESAPSAVIRCCRNRLVEAMVGMGTSAHAG